MATVSKVFIVVVLLAILIRIFIVDSFIVRGDSMAPTMLQGDYIFINKYAYRFNSPGRGDIIVAKPSVSNGANIIKRIIAMPDETIEITKNTIQIKTSRNDTGSTIDEPYIASIGTPEVGINRINIDPEEYFVMGDNRYASVDSREFGSVNSWDIKGKVIILFRFRGFSLKFF